MRSVSVVIPTLDEAASLPQLIACLRGQQGGGPSEIIVVDGGSRDETVALARESGVKIVALLPEAERGDPRAAYGARLMNPDPAVHVPAARVWHGYERALSVLRPASLALPSSFAEAGAAQRPVPNTPFLEWHYLSQGCFLEPGQLLRDAPRLEGIPGTIVQGRYDLLCPPEAAESLAAAWPDAELRMVAGAGHAVSESAILAGVVAAIDELGQRLG